MDIVCQGLGTSHWNDVLAPDAPWHRAVLRDPRLFPIRGGGRELRHPFRPRIVYPRVPDRTLNFGYDRLRHIHTVRVKTLDSTAVAKFADAGEDVVVREVWMANELSTFTSFFHALHAYHRETLPPGRYIGWRPRDLSPKNYAVELLDVQLGPPDEYIVEEIGKRPYVMREQLVLSFKLIREVFAPAGVLIGVGL